MLSATKKLLFQIQFQQSDSPYQAKSSDTFTSKFHELRQSIITNLQQFITVDVVPRPPPPHYIPTHAKLNRRAFFDSKKGKIVEYPRKNSFEVYVDNFLLFSRLESGSWPDVNGICEWALRVAEKMVDLEIEKEEAPEDKTRDLRDDREAIQNVIKTQRLPPVSRGFQKTLRSKGEMNGSMYPRSRYASLKVDDDTLPYGIDPLNDTVNRKMPMLGGVSFKRRQGRSIDKEIRTVPRGSRSQSRDQSFHWHLRQKSSSKINNFQGRVNEVHINTFEIPTRPQNVQLSPLPAVNEKATQEKKDEEPKVQGPEKVDIRISENSLNCYLPHYKLQGNRVTKLYYDEVWSPILCEHPLPLTGEYYFHIIVKSSKENQIQLGIAPLTYYPRQDHPQKPDGLLSFNCGSGQIKDAKHNSFGGETFWRQGGIKPVQQPPFHFIALINMKNRIIQWHVNQKIVASSKITSQFSNGFRAFVSLYNSKDVVMLNDKVHQLNEPKIINDIALNNSMIVNKQELKQMSNDKANVLVQTIDNSQPAHPLPVIQNRIYANSKVKETLNSKIDESVQTIPTFEGRIKRQRLLRIIEKNHFEGEREREKEKQQDFNQEDLEVLAKVEKEVVVEEKKETVQIERIVHERKEDTKEVQTIVSPSIRDQQHVEVRETAEKQPQIEEKEVTEERPVENQQKIQQNQIISDEVVHPAQQTAVEEQPQETQTTPPEIIPNQTTQPQQQQQISNPPKEQPSVPIENSRLSSQNDPSDLQWIATYQQGSFRLQQGKEADQQ